MSRAFAVNQVSAAQTIRSSILADYRERLNVSTQALQSEAGREYGAGYYQLIAATTIIIPTSLVVWRDGGSPREYLEDLANLHLNYLPLIYPDGFAPGFSEFAMTAVLLWMVGSPFEKRLINLDLAERDGAENLMLHIVAIWLYDLPVPSNYREKIDSVLAAKPKLLAEAANLYFQLCKLLPRASDGSDVILALKDNWKKRARNRFFSNELGANDHNEIYVDFLLSAICKKLSYHNEDIPNWEW